MTEAERERLEMLIGQCASLVHKCSKALRHGFDNYNPDIPGHKSNRDDIEREIAHVHQATRFMIDKYDVDIDEINKHLEEAPKHLEKYMRHQDDKKPTPPPRRKD